MEKSRDAFRTISEVAELLETPAHVLRFWESRFPQVRPVKRAGGRRYYRPTDVALLSGIKQLLHRDGLTIRGVQKVLREQGIRHVMSMADRRIAAEVVDAAPSETSTEAEGSSVLTDGAPAGETSAVRMKADVLVLASPQPPRSDPRQAEPLPLWNTAVEDASAVPASAAVVPEADDSNSLQTVTAQMPAEPSEDVMQAQTWIPTLLRSILPEQIDPHRETLISVTARLQHLKDRMTSAVKAGER